MDSTHVTPDLLDSMIQEDLPPAVLSRLMWEHVRGLCPTCRENLDLWLERNKAQRVGFGGSGPQPTAEAAAIARDELFDLLRTAPTKRRKRVEHSESRFRSPLLVDYLVEQVEERVHDDPRDAVHLAELACTVAERVVGLGSLERRVRAQAHLANALRARGDLDRSDHAFRQVRDLLGDGSAVHPRVFAEVDRLEASLRGAQKHYGAADKLLSRAILVSRVFGDRLATATALLKQSYFLFQVGRASEVRAVLREAADLADPDRDLRLACYARQHLVSFLADSGDFEAAAELLVESRPLFESYFATRESRKMALLLRWCEGRIARGLEDFPTAESALGEAAEGYVALDVGYDAALTYLDLAETLLVQDKVEEVARLATAVEPVLRVNGLTDEAVAALTLFRNAADRQTLTAALLDEVRRKLQDSRRGGG